MHESPREKKSQIRLRNETLAKRLVERPLASTVNQYGIVHLQFDKTLSQRCHKIGNTILAKPAVLHAAHALVYSYSGGEGSGAYRLLKPCMPR